MAALHFLQEMINQRISRAKDVNCRLAVSADEADLQLHHVPRTLCSALWCQLALAIADKKEFRPCKGCGQWIETSSGEYRAGRIFCSNACRSKAYREKQDKARQMFSQGKRIEVIAEELHSDIETVRGWVSAIILKRSEPSS
jgi:hypothetical protein